MVRQNGAATRPRLVIYTESYLHLNVFIFNALPRNGSPRSRRLRFGSSSLRPLADLSRASPPVSLCFAFLLWKSPDSLAPEERGTERRTERRARLSRECNLRRERGAFLRRLAGGPYGLISLCAPPPASQPFDREETRVSESSQVATVCRCASVCAREPLDTDEETPARAERQPQ